MKALIIVDWENEWIMPESEYYIGSDLKNYTERINTVIEKVRKNDYKIIFVKHNESEGEAFIENSDSTKFISDLNIKDSDIIVKKFKISPFYNTDLENHLKEVDEIFVCGILTNLCVRSTVQDAYDRDFKVNIIEDCCVAFDKETHEFTLKDIVNTRPEVSIIKSNEF